MLHGWTMWGATFDDVIARLGPTFRCAAPDLPGHGGATDRAPTLDACADVLAETLGLWPDEKPIVLGWSMGGAAAWRYIERFGTGRISGLVTVDMSPKLIPSDDWPYGLMGQTAESAVASTGRFAGDWHDAARGVAARMFAERDGAAGYSVDEALRDIRSQDPARLVPLWADLISIDMRPVIAMIDVPYLVCSGAQSRVYAAGASDWVAAHAPQATRHVFAHSGHSPHLEEPAEFARVIGKFAASTGR